MSVVKQLINPDYSNFARWMCDGKLIEISNQGRVVALLKNDGRILIVHIDKLFGRDNAFIYSSCGNFEKRIMLPTEIENSICFDDAYYDGADLTLIAASRDRRVACVISEDGDLIRMHESR